MCVCAFTCVYICVLAYMWVYLCMCSCVDMYVCVNIYVYCVHICVYACVCIYTGLYVCECALVCAPLSPHLFRQVCFEVQPPISLRLVNLWDCRTCPSWCGCRCAHHSWHLMWVLGIQTQVSMLCSKYFTHWVIYKLWGGCISNSYIEVIIFSISYLDFVCSITVLTL